MINSSHLKLFAWQVKTTQEVDNPPENPDPTLTLSSQMEIFFRNLKLNWHY